MKILAIILFVLMSADIYAANRTCQGDVTEIKLNTDYGNDVMAFTVNDIQTLLSESYWQTPEMEERAFSLMLAAQMSGRKVKYWGNEDCTRILKVLRIL